MPYIYTALGLAVETGNHFQNFQIFRNDADPFRTSLLMMNESVTGVFIIILGGNVFKNYNIIITVSTCFGLKNRALCSLL